MEFPLNLRFKFFTLAPKIYVLDRNGNELAFVRQKLLKLREHVQVYSDSTRAALLCDIKADRILDFSAAYKFTTQDGMVIGSVRRRGFRSLWRASYEILSPEGESVYEIHEKNPWVKVLDSLVGEIPVVGFFTGLLLHPKYAVSRNGEEVMTLTKRVSFLERNFSVELVKEVPEQHHLPIVLSLLMFTLLERSRG